MEFTLKNRLSQTLNYINFTSIVIKRIYIIIWLASAKTGIKNCQCTALFLQLTDSYPAALDLNAS